MIIQWKLRDKRLTNGWRVGVSMAKAGKLIWRPTSRLITKQKASAELGGLLVFAKGPTT
jgi:hypothetical protein